MDRYSAFEATAESQELMQSVRLHAVEWGTFFSCNGARTLKDLAERFEVSEEQMQGVLNRLLEAGMVVESKLSLQDYLARQGRARTQQEPMALQAFLEGADRVPSEEAPRPRKLRLGALIEFVVGHSPSRTEGQLAVYRVFLRVPPDLLKRNGIKSLSLVDNQTEVEDAELIEALEFAVKEAVGLDLPENVWG